MIIKRVMLRGGAVALATAAALTMGVSAGAAQAIPGPAEQPCPAVQPAPAATTGQPITLDVTSGIIGLTPTSSTPATDGPAITLNTQAASRGTTPLDLTPATTTAVSPGLFTTTRADLTETVQAIPGGAEQSWCFPQPPPGTGELTLTLATTGLTYQATTSDGIHFSHDPATGLAYHNGTWTDAAGQHWAVPVHYTNGTIQLTVPAAALTTSAYPAQLDPKVVVIPITT
jgi:hypothetical protein